MSEVDLSLRANEIADLVKASNELDKPDVGYLTGNLINDYRSTIIPAQLWGHAKRRSLRWSYDARAVNWILFGTRIVVGHTAATREKVGEVFRVTTQSCGEDIDALMDMLAELRQLYEGEGNMNYRWFVWLLMQRGYKFSDHVASDAAPPNGDPE